MNKNNLNPFFGDESECENNDINFTVIIPARFKSTRLYGKPLLEIAGKPMIWHVYQQAILTKARVIIATDDDKIEKVCREFGAEVCMTSPQHTSGTERLAEVVDIIGLDDDEIVVNLQGDEPLINPQIISDLAENLAKSVAVMATFKAPITDAEELLNPNVVKVVSDKNDNALYFSRAPIIYGRDEMVNLEQLPKEKLDYYLANVFRHIGIYAYRAGFIQKYINLAPAPMEKLENLEQLRALYHGYKINVSCARFIPGVGVDTAEDLAKVRAILENK